MMIYSKPIIRMNEIYSLLIVACNKDEEGNQRNGDGSVQVSHGKDNEKTAVINTNRLINQRFEASISILDPNLDPKCPIV